MPVASRSLELWRRSCQPSTRMATQPLERAMSHASPNRPTITRMLPNGG